MAKAFSICWTPVMRSAGQGLQIPGPSVSFPDCPQPWGEGLQEGWCLGALRAAALPTSVSSPWKTVQGDVTESSEMKLVCQSKHPSNGLNMRKVGLG